MFSVTDGLVTEDERLCIMRDTETLFSWVVFESFDYFLRRGGYLLFIKIVSLGVLPVCETGFSVLLKSKVLDNSLA